MVDSKESYKFDLGVKGLKYKMCQSCLHTCTHWNHQIEISPNMILTKKVNDQ